MDQRYVDAAVGAGLTVLFFFVPLSPAAGGAVAARRHGGDTRTGAWVGALSGLLAAAAVVPVLVFVLLAFVVLPVARTPDGPTTAALVLLAGTVLAVVGYLVGGGAAGGALWGWRYGGGHGGDAGGDGENEE